MELAAARTITLFADYVCPFSYLTARGLAAMAEELHFDIVRRAFELAPAPLPHAPPPSDETWQIVEQVAAELGAPVQRPGFVPRTRKAHEAVKFAASVGMAAVLDRAIYDAYFAERADIGRIDVLVSIAERVGMDALGLKLALDLDAHADAVAADRAAAEQLEITGTPAFVAGTDVHVGHLSNDQLRDWLGE